MGKLSPSTLQKLLEELDDCNLSKSKKACIRALAEAELYRKTEENSFKEFHHWLRRGDQILTDLESQIFQIKNLSSKTGCLVDKHAVTNLLATFDFREPSNDSEKTIHWIIGCVRREIEKLPTIKKSDVEVFYEK